MTVRKLAIVVVGDRYAVDGFFQSLRRHHPFVRTDDAATQVVTDGGCKCCEKTHICLLEPIEEDQIQNVLALADNLQIAACPCAE